MAIGTALWQVLPIWLNSTRPVFPTAGYIGFNIDSGDFEGYDGSTWVTLSGGGGGGGSVSDGDYGDIVVSGSGLIWTIDNNVVTDAKLRTSAGNSVIGRSGGTPGNVADIVASGNGDVFRMTGGSLGWGNIPESSVTNLVSDLASKVATTFSVTTINPIQVDGLNIADLSGALLFTILYATTSATGAVELATDGENASLVVPQGNDRRLNYPTWPRTLLENTSIDANHSAVVCGPFNVDTFTLTLGTNSILRVI